MNDETSAEDRLINAALETKARYADASIDEEFLARVNQAIDRNEQSESIGNWFSTWMLPLTLTAAAILILSPLFFLGKFQPNVTEEKVIAVPEPAPISAAEKHQPIINTTPTPILKPSPMVATRGNLRRGKTIAVNGRNEIRKPVTKKNPPWHEKKLLAKVPTELKKSASDWGQNANDVFHFGVTLGHRVVTTRKYDELIDNPWANPIDDSLSTFSIDVDTASFAHVRGLINHGHGRKNIHKDAIRIEEWINYFDWNYPEPEGADPFTVSVEVAECPWKTPNKLMKIGLQGMHVARDELPPSNLIFLVDVSGSMNSPKKIGLVKECLSFLAEEMSEDDRIAIVVYASSEGLALESTPGSDQEKIQSAIEQMAAGGSTNGGAGIKLAYQVAEKHFIEEGINRVVLCTDGDFNVGTTDQDELVELIEKKAANSIFLTVAGFGNDNLNDSMLEAISNKGNGNYFHIDSLKEARQVFLHDLPSTIMTIAKDVKIQVEFNPARVEEYRLIGYANRILEAEDFDNDAIDAGEIGAGHRVTALYELVPSGAAPDLRYQKKRKPRRELVDSKELGWVKLRYKAPAGGKSRLMERPVFPNNQSWKKASDDFKFASAVALLGMKLRDHKSAKNQNFSKISELAKSGLGEDLLGKRAEIIRMIKLLQDQDNGAKPGETIHYEGGVDF